MERIEREEGSWQSRITGEFDPEEIRAVHSFAGVTNVEVWEEESGETVLDLYFQNMSQVLEDTPKVARLAGASKEDVTYHHALLSMYLVRDPEDPAPRLVFPFFILVTLLASISLIVIIHNAFAVSMNDRVYQLGILSSVGLRLVRYGRVSCRRLRFYVHFPFWPGVCWGLRAVRESWRLPM